MRRQAVLLLLCSLAAIASSYFTPHQMLADLQPVTLETMIPKQFGEWSMIPANGEIISSPEQERFVKSIYSQVLTRTYIDQAGHHIMLSIAYTRDQSDNSGTQSHKPEICYPAQGFIIKNSMQRAFHTKYGAISVRQLVTQHLDRVEPLSYWTMVGKWPVQGTIQTKMAQMKYGFQNVVADGLIFRISMINNNANDAYIVQERFLEQLMDSLPIKNRTRLAGLSN